MGVLTLFELHSVPTQDSVWPRKAFGGIEKRKSGPVLSLLRRIGKKQRIGHPRREKRKESFMPVEITGGWVRVENRDWGKNCFGVVCAGSSGPER